MVEILDANDNLPVFEDRPDLTVPLNEVGFYHQLKKRLFPTAIVCSGVGLWVSVETVLIVTDAL